MTSSGSRPTGTPPRTFAITVVQPGQTMGTTIGPNKATCNDDIITGRVGIGSQLDRLGHLGIDNVGPSRITGAVQAIINPIAIR